MNGCTTAFRPVHSPVCEPGIARSKIVEWTSGRVVAELETVLQAGVPAHRVSMATDVFSDPQRQARDHWAQISRENRHGDGRSATLPPLARRLPPHPSPTLGQHNDVVLTGAPRDERRADHGACRRRGVGVATVQGER